MARMEITSEVQDVLDQSGAFITSPEQVIFAMIVCEIRGLRRDLTERRASPERAAEPQRESEEGTLRLAFSMPDKIFVIKCLREVFGLSLKEAKEVSEGARFLVTDQQVGRLNQLFQDEERYGSGHVAPRPKAGLEPKK